MSVSCRTSRDSRGPSACILGPHLSLVDLAVGGIGDRAVLVPIAARAETLDDHETDDRLVLVGAGALRATLRLAVGIRGLGERHDLPEHLPPLLVHFDLRF